MEYATTITYAMTGMPARMTSATSVRMAIRSATTLPFPDAERAGMGRAARGKAAARVPRIAGRVLRRAPTEAATREKVAAPARGTADRARCARPRRIAMTEIAARAIAAMAGCAHSRPFPDAERAAMGRAARGRVAARVRQIVWPVL